MDETATLQYQSQLATGPFRSCFTPSAIDHKSLRPDLPGGGFLCPDIPFVSTRATWRRVLNGSNVECSRRSGVRRTDRRSIALAVQGVTRPNCVIKTIAERSDGTSVRLATGSCVYTGVVRSEFPSALATPIQPSRDARCEAAAAPKQQAAASRSGHAAGRDRQMNTDVRLSLSEVRMCSGAVRSRARCLTQD